MKTSLSIAAALGVAVSSMALAADEPGKCCAMPKPQPPPSCCCCAKMQKTDVAAAAPSLDQLLSNAKEAKGDQLLDALAAVLNRLIEERKAVQPSPAPGAAASPAHQH